MIKTELQKKLGIKYPIVQAGMGPYSTYDLCAAAAKAGGVGIISTIGMGVGLSAATPDSATKIFGKGKPKDLIKNAVEGMAEELQDYPDAVYGVNCPVSREFITVARRLFKGIIEAYEENDKVREKMKVIITSAGDPLPWAVDAKSKGARRQNIPLKEKLPGITWMHVVPSVGTALRTEKAGADFITASGREGGAHCAWRDTSSVVLVPEVVKRVNTPVIAAGGFCDGNSLAAALAMGAVGIQMGTRCIATQESDFVQMWKEAIVERSEEDTLIARGLFGPMRFLRNKQSLRLVDETIKGASDLFRGIPVPSTNEIMKLEMEGLSKMLDEDEENSIILGGIVSGRIHEIPKVKELFDSIMEDAEKIITNLPKQVIEPEKKEVVAK
ncbi:MAG: hypothetical protein GF329_11245 [Candidatus Lokiarchaeota archaeon]|nr:hypothetical protein [Candidatus Lokiarchaeota archaeon]